MYYFPNGQKLTLAMVFGQGPVSKRMGMIQFCITKIKRAINFITYLHFLTFFPKGTHHLVGSPGGKNSGDVVGGHTKDHLHQRVSTLTMVM